jgi:hypothetical protein
MRGSKEVGPSTKLRRWLSHDPKKWDMFLGRYFSELRHNAEVWAPILKATRRERATLPFSSHDTEHNNVLALKGFLDARMSSKAPPRRHNSQGVVKPGACRCLKSTVDKNKNTEKKVVEQNNMGAVAKKSAHSGAIGHPVLLGSPILTFHLNAEIERIRETMAGRAELQDAGQEQTFGWS